MFDRVHKCLMRFNRLKADSNLEARRQFTFFHEVAGIHGPQRKEKMR